MTRFGHYRKIFAKTQLADFAKGYRGIAIVPLSLPALAANQLRR